MKLVLILLASIAFGELAAASSLAEVKDDKRAQQLEAEKRKLDRTKDPADRAESLMKIADITLTYVGDAITANDLPKLESYVEEYQEAVMVAHDTMMTSGPDPYKRRFVVCWKSIAKRRLEPRRPPIAGQARRSP
jgi:hypothetical protein